MTLRFSFALMLLIALPALAADPANLLTNPDFDTWQDGVPVGWTLDQGADESEVGAGPISTAERIADAPDGRSALRLRGDTHTRRWLAAKHPRIAVAPGDVLILGGWFRLTDVAPDGHRFTNCQLGVILRDADDDVLGYHMAFRDTGSTDWSEAEITIQAPPRAADAEVIVFLSMTGALDVTGVRLERLAIPAADPSLDHAGRWRTDIDLLARLLPRLHPDPFTVTGRDVFESDLAAVAAVAPELDDLACGLALTRAVATLADGHTQCVPPQLGRETFPLQLYRFEDGLHVVAAARVDELLLKGRVIRYGDRDVDDLWRELRTYVSAENEIWPRWVIPQFMVNTVLAGYLGLLDDDGALPITVRHPDGRELTCAVAALDGESEPDIVTASPPVEDQPLSWRIRGKYGYERVGDAMYVCYRRCSEDRRRPMAAFTADLLADLDRQPVRRFILDMRDNSGGSSPLLNPLIQGVAERVASGVVGRTFVITGRRTYSSATLNVCDFVRHAGATVVGEPMGNKPNHFGQVQSMTLPNTGMVLQYSTKAFHRVEGDPETLEPDVVVPVLSGDWFAGRDAAVEAVLEMEL